MVNEIDIRTAMFSGQPLPAGIIEQILTFLNEHEMDIAGETQ
jgi:hypothetical protein